MENGKCWNCDIVGKVDENWKKIDDNDIGLNTDMKGLTDDGNLWIESW